MENTNLQTGEKVSNAYWKKVVAIFLLAGF